MAGSAKGPRSDLAQALRALAYTLFLQIQAGIDGAEDAIVIWNDMVDGQPQGTSVAVLHTRAQGRSGSAQMAHAIR